MRRGKLPRKPLTTGRVRNCRTSRTKRRSRDSSCRRFSLARSCWPMATSPTELSTSPWPWLCAASLTASSLSSSRLSRHRYTRSVQPQCSPRLSSSISFQLLLQNLDGAQNRVRQHASSSMMSSMMRGRPAPGGLEVEDVE